MKYTSIIEKLLCLFNILTSSWLDLVIIGIILFIIFLAMIKSLSKVSRNIMISIVYLSFLGFIIYLRFDNLSTIFNSLIDNMFTSIYFPSVYVYLFILLVIDIVFVITSLNKNIAKVYKIINKITFGIINFLFIITLDIIGTNNVDIFSKLSLFGNSNLITMLEISVGIFIIWIISLVIVYIINKLTEYIMIYRDNKEFNNDSVNLINPVLEIDTNSINNSYEEKERITTFLPKVSEEINYKPVYNNIPVSNTFEPNELIAPQKELSVINSNDTIMDKIIKNELPVIETKPAPVDNYTLNDYRIFNNMLKDIKEFTQSSTINIDKNLEYRLITKYSNDRYNMFKKMLENYSN